MKPEIASTALALLLACSQAHENGLGAGEPAATKPAPSDFVVFSRDRLVISRLGTPVPVPVTVGSSPSQATLASEAPNIVAVTANGELVGLMNGTTRITNLSSAGDFLDVEVCDASVLALLPETLILRPGQLTRMRLIALNREVPLEEAECGVWGTAGSALASVLGNAAAGALVLEGGIVAGSAIGAAIETWCPCVP